MWQNRETREHRVHRAKNSIDARKSVVKAKKRNKVPHEQDAELREIKLES